MQYRSNNIIPLNEKSAQYSFLRDVCDQLNQLTIKHIHPAIDSLIPHLIEKIEAQLEQTSNNHDIMIKMEIKNALQKNNSQITSLFKEQSSSSNFEPTPDREEVDDLILLDNMELDRRLAWITIATKMADKDNLQTLFRIKNRFENTFPDFKEQIPASPEKLCESFSSAIDIIRPEDTLKQQLVIWFTQYIKEPSDLLWDEADQLLEDIGLELKLSTKAPEGHSYRSTSKEESLSKTSLGDVKHSRITRGVAQDEENFNPEFMDSLADKLVTHVENMLIRDDLIPESKKYQVRAIDLAGILSGLQHEIIQQHTSITNLTESIQSVLDKNGEKSKLSPRHEDLINLIGMLFEYILEDHQLPENIRKSISLLQIPVLRTVILDRNFLTERSHPARELLSEMTSVGAGCTDNCFTDPVYLLIDSIVHIIISQSYENPNIFKECLERFRTELDIINQPEEALHHNVEKETASNEEAVTDHQEDNGKEISDNNEANDQISNLLLKENNFDDEEEIILESSMPEKISPCITTNEVMPDSDNIEEIMPLISKKEQPSTLLQFTPIEGLKIGQWVEFVGEGKSHRLSCKLAQIDRDTNRYIFENRSGMKVTECNGTQLLKDIKNGSIIIKPDVQIFDRALQAVFVKFKI